VGRENKFTFQEKINSSSQNYDTIYLRIRIQIITLGNKHLMFIIKEKTANINVENVSHKWI
jgi:hypothetical protein